MTAATCRHGSHPDGACRECARAADRASMPIGHDQPRDRTPAIGERRPREGRCKRCDRPLSDLVWTVTVFAGLPVDGWAHDRTDPTRCGVGVVDGSGFCDGEPVDWRARALAAEARLSVPVTSAALDAFRAKRAATHVCEHGSLARKCGDCDSVESGLEAGAWQARALAAEESVEVCNAMISQLIGDREMDEARGRAHGLLAAAMLMDGRALSVDMNGVPTGLQLPLDAAVCEIAELAAEATDGAL